jgi:hypothetical protein
MAIFSATSIAVEPLSLKKKCGFSMGRYGHSLLQRVSAGSWVQPAKITW